MRVTVRFCSILPQFRGRKPWGWPGPPPSLPVLPTPREDLRLDSYLKYSHAAKALYIYKHPCLLRDSNPVPTAPQSASLTTVPVWRFFYLYCWSTESYPNHTNSRKGFSDWSRYSGGAKLHRP
ncbi:uncharacterized protein TNCV_3230561 [Trichonephila clavipes]|nr:uncharacterized protein TNCV_3230561 [Trichonephila clavipes]